MDTSSTFDLTAPVRYNLSHRPTAGGQVDLVLDLFRGAVQIHTRTIVSVEREEAVLVMAKCRRYLQLRGVDAAPSAKPAPSASANALKASGAAPTAKSATPPMRPIAGVKPMVAPSKPPLGAVPVAARTTPAQPARSAVVPARTVATKQPGPARRDRPQETRMPAPAAAAFDWMFQAV